MKIKILTLFPEMFSALDHSILGRAKENSLLSVELYNIRDYTTDKHGKCDDYPFGGGAGMVMTPQPLFDCINAADPNREMLRIYMSPKGEVLKHGVVKELAVTGGLLILCGHYEGIDQRVIDLCIDREISVGDYVLTGGELPAMVLVDAVSRFVEGVLGKTESAFEDSFSDGLLEYPQYTRPQEFMGLGVPEVLVSGHHENVRKWRRQQSLEITRKNRPDLLDKNGK